MKKYKVRSTVQANEQVLKYAEYIRYELLNPQAANKLVSDIRKAAKSLDQMPERNPLTEEEPWRSMGIRKMIVRGYIVYYNIAEETGTVHIIGVVYGKRNQTDQLENMDFE